MLGILLCFCFFLIPVMSRLLYAKTIEHKYIVFIIRNLGSSLRSVRYWLSYTIFRNLFTSYTTQHQL